MSAWAEWLTPAAARWINNEMARVVAQYSDRFRGLAHVAAVQPGAATELERAVRQLGLKGLGITSHIGQVTLDQEALGPLYAKAAELRIPIFVHGSALPLQEAAFQTHNLARSLGRPMDLLAASTRLLCTDLLERFPDLTFVIAHLGGGFQAHSRRLKHFYAAEIPHFDQRLKQVYFDTAPP